MKTEIKYKENLNLYPEKDYTDFLTINSEDFEITKIELIHTQWMLSELKPVLVIIKIRLKENEYICKIQFDSAEDSYCTDHKIYYLASKEYELFLEKYFGYEI